MARMRATGRADQCPQLGVERTQRGRRRRRGGPPSRARPPTPKKSVCDVDI